MPLRVALLSYRSKPHSGGQGIYVRHLSRELVRLGHQVEVFSGQPLPELDPGVGLTPLPSLDLYREPDPFRTPHWSEFRSPVDVLEWSIMITAGFPEPLTFSLRAWQHLRERLAEFDVVHDNQCLGYGLLGLRRTGVPVVATIHHPITVDRRLELAAAADWKRRYSVRRWYGFTTMQARVARRLPWLTTVSGAARDEIVTDFGVTPEQLRVIGVGVDVDTFQPATTDEVVPGRIVTVASADVPLKGLDDLIEAIAKLRTERDVELVVVGKLRPGGAAEQSINRLGLTDAVRFVSGISDADLAALFRSAEVAVVPSRYEGFSLPAIEAMACGAALVATSAGALPEVTGPDGHAVLQVPPSDVEAMTGAIRRILDDPALRRRLGAAGRARVVENFTWTRTAQRTADWYAEAIEAQKRARTC
ncbi:glycosyltransferase family 4 protein [Micromonosporaceae bacterium DT194]|uniref:glycosyltransferase family 4 protein n=1 Tax=Melissospora conviva TaxID=3388432 RepID=UPI003C22E2C8